MEWISYLGNILVIVYSELIQIQIRKKYMLVYNSMK